MPQLEKAKIFMSGRRPFAARSQGAPVCTRGPWYRRASDAGETGYRNPKVLDRCARIFRAMGDPGRLRLLPALAQGAACVGDLAQTEGDSMTVISQRLRVLRTEDIIRRRREGKHVIYELADQHTLSIVPNGLAHAAEHLHIAMRLI